MGATKLGGVKSFPDRAPKHILHRSLQHMPRCFKPPRGEILGALRDGWLQMENHCFACLISCSPVKLLAGDLRAAQQREATRPSFALDRRQGAESAALAQLLGEARIERAWLFQCYGVVGL